MNTYQEIASEVLPGWEISLAFVSPGVARSLNKKLRRKSYTPNVLSYTVGPKHGEIIICKEVAAKEAKSYGHTTAAHIVFLFIHGLLHLKGMAHGTTMERREQALLARFARSPRRIPNATHNNRHRHRHLSGKGGRRRGNRG